MQVMISDHEECPLRGPSGQCKVADQDSDLHAVGGCCARLEHEDDYIPEDCPLREHDVVVGLYD